MGLTGRLVSSPNLEKPPLHNFELTQSLGFWIAFILTGAKLTRRIHFLTQTKKWTCGWFYCFNLRNLGWSVKITQHIMEPSSQTMNCVGCSVSNKLPCSETSPFKPDVCQAQCFQNAFLKTKVLLSPLRVPTSLRVKDGCQLPTGSGKSNGSKNVPTIAQKAPALM